MVDCLYMSAWEYLQIHVLVTFAIHDNINWWYWIRYGVGWINFFISLIKFNIQSINILMSILIFISFDNVKGPEKPVSSSLIHFYRFSLLLDFNTLHFSLCTLDCSSYNRYLKPLLNIYVYIFIYWLIFFKC